VGKAGKETISVEDELQRAQTELAKLSTRLHAEAAERRRLEEVLHSLPSQILQAQDAERKRIAAELHDGVNQVIGSVKFRLAHLESQLPKHAPALSEALTLLDRALAEIRTISENLLPSELEQFGLVAAAESLIYELQQRTEIRVDFQRGPIAKRLPPALELAFYRILQEALSNIEKHSGATRVYVSVSADAKFATLNIRDDGRGFSVGKKGRGFGLINMRERAHALEGVFDIVSQIGDGTEISVHLKFAE
jgi:two-component system, NarL family, sensor kinase